MTNSNSKTTDEVLQHHLQSFGKGDLDGLMEDYTEDSVVMTETDTLVGLDAIRGLLQELTTNMLPPGCDFEMLKLEVSGEVAYIVWKAESETFNFSYATDTFVIQDGKIAKQTFAGVIEPKG